MSKIPVESKSPFWKITHLKSFCLCCFALRNLLLKFFPFNLTCKVIINWGWPEDVTMFVRVNMTVFWKVLLESPLRSSVQMRPWAWRVLKKARTFHHFLLESEAPATACTSLKVSLSSFGQLLSVNSFCLRNWAGNRGLKTSDQGHPGQCGKGSMNSWQLLFSHKLIGSKIKPLIVHETLYLRHLDWLAVSHLLRATGR